MKMNVFSKGKRKPQLLLSYQSKTICTALGHWIFEAKSLGIFSVRRFFGGNFQAPHKQRFRFCDSSLFLYTTMTLTTTLLRHLAHAQKRTTNLRTHDLKISGKMTSKYKSEGNFSHIKKASDDLCDLGLIGVT